MKRTMLLLLMIVILLLSVLSVHATTASSSAVYYSCDETGAYVIRYNGKHADVIHYSTQNLSVGLELQYKICAVSAYRGHVVLFCDDTANQQLIVYIYYLDTDALENFAIYDMKLYAETDFSCDNQAIYIENHRDNKELIAYSYDGNLLDRYRFSSEITDVFSGFHNGTYAVAGSTLYQLSGDRFSSLSGSSVKTPLFPADQHILISPKGYVYVINGNKIDRQFPVSIDHSAATACMIGDRLYCLSGSYINGYDIETGEKVSYYHLSQNASLIYSDRDQIVAVGGSSSVTVDVSSFIEMKKDSENYISDDGTVSYFDGVNDDSSISSDIYTVDFDKYQISAVPAGSTVADFKSHMRYNGYKLTLYRSDSVKKSGLVGTAMTAVFETSGNSITFELAVIGDLTGEGNCNSRDLNLLMDHLLGSVTFDGVYSIAADVSKNGTIDAADMLRMKNRI